MQYITRSAYKKGSPQKSRNILGIIIAVLLMTCKTTYGL